MNQHKHSVKVRVRRNNKLVISYLLGAICLSFLEWLSDLQVKLDKPVSVRR